MGRLTQSWSAEGFVRGPFFWRVIFFPLCFLCVSPLLFPFLSLQHERRGSSGMNKIKGGPIKTLQCSTSAKMLWNGRVRKKSGQIREKKYGQE